MEKSLQAELLARARELEVVRFGDFKLASGQKSKYYVDGRLAGLDGRAASLIGRIITEQLPPAARSIGGPAVSAVPLIASVLIAASSGRPDLGGFYVRERAKAYGRRRLLEGRPLSPAVIVDDTCTTGSSLLKVAALLEKRSIKVIKIITVFDRGAGRRVIEGGYDYSAIINVDENGRLAVA